MSYTQLIITGVVQSVGFRPFIQKVAVRERYNGFVRNLSSAGVEIVIDNDPDNFVKIVQMEKPELSQIIDIKRIDISKTEVIQTLNECGKSIDDIQDKFIILPSLKISTDNGFSALPPDIAICSDCIEDMKHGTRFDYAFTSCTNCGPRYSTIYGLPYDREMTSFSEFPLCKQCMTEYTDITNRRLHAQTTCCSLCGPHYFYISSNEAHNIIQKGIKLNLKNKIKNWKMVSNSIEHGEIWAIMGLGGTHFVTDGLNSESISKLRMLKRKDTNKPFAVMMRDIITVMKYCEVSKQDIKILNSVRRPIVIIPIKKEYNDLFTQISPGLSTIGVMLPYTGIHYILFKYTQLDILLMTSANEAGIPMPILPDDIIKLYNYVDHFLLHNRRIVQRVDDSVIRSHSDHHLIIRRSRGYVPQPLYHSSLIDLHIDNRIVNDAISLGTEEIATAAIMKNGWLVATQHIGDIDNLESLEFLNNSLQHIITLFSVEPQLITIDLHPTFMNRQLLSQFQNKYNAELLEVQHHVAHASSLALDHNIDHNNKFLVWTLDGFGYGADGNAWGGELIGLHKGGWTRESHITPIRYDGGDINARYPARMLLLYLQEIEKKELLTIDYDRYNIVQHLQHKDREFSFLQKSKHKDPKIWTTGTARFLDSVSALLGINYFRSYRGEPAITLEDVALYRIKSDLSHKDNILFSSGVNSHELDSNFEIKTSKSDDDLIYINKNIVDTVSIMADIVRQHKAGKRKQDIALFAHKALAYSFAEMGTQIVHKYNQNKLGISGGVAYNNLIPLFMRNYLRNQGIELLEHKNIPPGDAGISLGQLNYLGYISDK